MEAAAPGIASLPGLVIKKELADDFSYPTESSFSAQSPSTAKGTVSEHCTMKLKWGQTENCICEFSTKRLKTSNIVEEGEDYTIEINPNWQEELSDFSQCGTGSGLGIIKPELNLHAYADSEKVKKFPKVKLEPLENIITEDILKTAANERENDTFRTCNKQENMYIEKKVLKQPKITKIPEAAPASNSILPATSQVAPAADSILSTISQAATASNCALPTTSQASKDSSVSKESSSPLRLLSVEDPTCLSPSEDSHFSEDNTCCIIGMFDSAVGQDDQSGAPLHENTRTLEKHLLLKTKVSQKKDPSKGCSTNCLKLGVTSDDKGNDLYNEFLLSSIRCNESYLGLEVSKQKKIKLEIELLKMQIQQLESESRREQDS